MPVNNCRCCGGAFETKDPRVKYCGGPCLRVHERAYSRRARASHTPERRHAANAVSTAIQYGRLIPKPCEICGQEETVAHHDDYRKPLEVRWLCRSHHQFHHIAHGPGLGAFA